MKKILSMALIVALCMSVSLNVFAAGFNAGVEIKTDKNGNTTITVQDSGLYEKQNVTLTVACSLNEAYVVYEGKAVESSLDVNAKKIAFSVIGGGTYTIKEGTPSEDELPEEPETPDQPDQPDTPTNPDTPDTPDTPDEPQRPQRPVKPIGPETEEPSEEEPQPAELPFSDLAEADWFYNDVAWVYEQGLMKGMPNGTFAPGVATSRGMIVTILWRLEGQPAPVSTSPFADVKIGSYYEQAIAWAAENQIVNGVSETAFQPDTSITREQFATILYRYAKNYKGCDVSVGEDTNILSYNDAFSISDYAFPALQWACGAGLMNGSGDALMPGGFATRAQAAALLHRFCQTY